MLLDWIIISSVISWFIWGLCTAAAWTVYSECKGHEQRARQRKLAARVTLCLPVAPLAVVVVIGYYTVWVVYRVPYAVRWLYSAAFPGMKKRLPDPGTTESGPFR